MSGARQRRRTGSVALALAALAGAVPAQEQAAAPPSPAAQDAAAAAQQRKQHEQQLLQQYQQIKPVRAPNAVLQAHGQLRAGIPAALEGPALFQAILLAGRWDLLGDHLRALPEDLRDKVYDHALAALAHPAGTLFPDDVLPLADACPGELTETRLAALGALLARAGATGGDPRHLLETIAAGTGRFGGDAPAKRAAAARLLLGAKMVTAARPYLPPLPDEPGDEDLGTLDLHAQYFEARSTGVGIDDPLRLEEEKEAALQDAWRLTERAIATDPGTPPEPPTGDPPDPTAARAYEAAKERYAAATKAREAAIQRAVRLVSRLPRAQGDAWLDDVFRRRQHVGTQLLIGLANQIAGARAQADPGARSAVFAGARRTVEHLLARSGELAPWKLPLNVLALAWLDEAAYTLGYAPGVPAGEAGSPASVAQQTVQQLVAERRKANVQPIPSSGLLELAPADSWLDAVNPDVAERMRRTVTLLRAQAFELETTLPYLRQLVGRDPAFAKQIADQLVGSWRETHTISSNRYYGSSYVSGNVYYQQNQNVPITRARQVRNLRSLAELLDVLRAIEGLPALDPQSVAAAFTGSHSPAEVYRREDIELVYGSLADVPASAVAWLAQEMRQKLAGQWRKPETQQQAGTNRTTPQIAAEVGRGYEVAAELTRLAAERDGTASAWSLYAMLQFDFAEFLYGQKVDLRSYVALRDRAFAAFGRAAALYRAEVEGKRPPRPDGSVYQQWFQAALGASDLAYLTRQDEPDEGQIDKIAAALRALPADQVDAHLGWFGSALENAAPSVPPQLKERYLRHGLRVLGDHDGAKTARDLLALYDELRAETELALVLDGGRAVGHGRPFGVHLLMRYTSSVGRESDGFKSFLHEKAYSYQTGQQETPREELERRLREALGERFEIQTVTFHAPDVGQHAFGREGWRQTPFAYLTLAAKDPAVDRIPPVQLDLLFNDGRGTVLLPVETREVQIDAATEPEATALGQVDLVQTLDLRLVAEEDTVRLEVVAKGEQILPGIEHLVDLVVPGYEVTATNDRGLAIHELSLEDGVIRPVCERAAVIDYTPVAGDPRAARFAYPPPRVAGWTVAHKTFGESDIVDASAVLDVPEIRTRLPRRWPWLVAGLLAAAAALGSVLMLLRRRRLAAALPRARYELPAQLTPFGALALLRRVAADPEIALTGAERSELARAMEGIETRFFAPRANGSDGADLRELAARWVDRAARH